MIKDILAVNQDYKRVRGLWGYEDYESPYYVKEYFEDTGYGLQEPLANNYAMIRANQYVEFVTSQLFCPDGSWIGFQSKENTASAKRAASKLVNYLSDKLAETSFYRQITKLIKEGVLYNRGIIDTYYDKGIQFNTFKNMDISISEDCDEANKRAYITKYISSLDLVQGYEGEAVERRQAIGGDELVKQVKIVIAILPINKHFFAKRELNTKYKYKKCYFCVQDSGDLEYIKRKDQDESGYMHFPLMTYHPHTKTSLAQLAVPMAARLNEYEQLIGENARKSNRPAIAVPDTLLTHDNFDLNEGGLVPLATNDRIPTPIESKQRMSLDSNEIERLERKIDIIFKTHLIERVHITNVSQFEASRNYLNALKAIQPSAADLVTRVPITLLSRVHSLLTKHDPEYRRLAKAANGKLTMFGLTAKMTQLKKASNLGYYAQSAAPFVEMNPSSVQVVDTDKALKELAAGLDVADIVRTEEEIEAERQAIAQQEQAAQAQEAQMAQADVAAKQAQAESALSR